VDTTLHDPLIGHTLDGRYRIEARIAVGGMATVYRAVDIRLDRLLALKVMHPGLAADSEFIERFIREAKSVARLDHPNVVGVYDQGSDGTYVYLAMEYIAGCTLRDVLRERGALRPRAALDILEPVLAALGAAHRAGLVHRDMKPENVLIGDDGRVKVADFGLVRAVDTNTTASSGSVLGTVSYMAPEQIEHGHCDPRSDVYACGLLLHEMLTGSKPHTGGTPMQVIYQRLNQDIAPPSATVPGLAPQLDALVTGAAARDPRLRPADAAQLLAGLHSARQTLTDEQLDAMPPAAAVAATHSEDLTAAIPRTPATGMGSTDTNEVLNRTSRFQVPMGELLEPPEPGRRSRRTVIALVAAVLLALGLGTGVWYISDGQFTRTPGVLALPRAEAEKQLDAAGLNTAVAYGFSETVAKGDVISTRPAPGGRVRSNGTVTLTISKGPERVRVPDAVGKTLAQARQRLKSAGLAPGTVTKVFDNSIAAGIVISTEPAAGTLRSPDNAVAITVSKGRPIDAPDVVGDSVADAQQKLQDAGLKVTLADARTFSDTVTAGGIAQQSPSAGIPLARGDTVTLTLSKGQDMIDVPDVSGKKVADAKQILQDAGFNVRVIRFFFTGTVSSQSPGAGGQAARGSTVTLWVG
jgi:beta-lactam-binding protein with PASTA domain